MTYLVVTPDVADVRCRGHLVQAEEKQLLLIGEPRVVHHLIERVAGVDGVCSVGVVLKSLHTSGRISIPRTPL